MYIQVLWRNERESLILNDCHCGETNCIGYDPNILVRPENNVLLMLIDNQFAPNGRLTKYCDGSYIHAPPPPPPPPPQKKKKKKNQIWNETIEIPILVESFAFHIVLIYVIGRYERQKKLGTQRNAENI